MSFICQSLIRLKDYKLKDIEDEEERKYFTVMKVNKTYQIIEPFIDAKNAVVTDIDRIEEINTFFKSFHE